MNTCFPKTYFITCGRVVVIDNPLNDTFVKNYSTNRLNESYTIVTNTAHIIVNNIIQKLMNDEFSMEKAIQIIQNPTFDNHWNALNNTEKCQSIPVYGIGVLIKHALVDDSISSAIFKLSREEQRQSSRAINPIISLDGLDLKKIRLEYGELIEEE